MPERERSEAMHMLGEPEELELRFDEVSYAKPSAGNGIWVVPGNGIICIFREKRMAGACSTTVRAYRHGIVLQTYKHRDGKPTSFQVVGIVPDAVQVVPAKIGKRWTTLTVRANTFFAKADKPIGVPLGLRRQR